MKRIQANLRWDRPGVSAAVVVCLLLLALISVVQVTHLHPTASEADHCAVCIVMHSAAPMAMGVTAIVLVQLGISAPAVMVSAPARKRQLKLVTRPPPQSW